jgi:hypothetical protein
MTVRKRWRSVGWKALAAFALWPVTAAVAEPPADSVTSCQPNLVALYTYGMARTGRTGMEWYDSSYWQSDWIDAQSIPRTPGAKANYKRNAHSHSLSDCSNQQYLCVKAGGLEDVYAAPRGPITSGQHYTHAGHEFTIVGCYGTDCRSHVIVTKPARGADRLVFIYERARGIIAYGTLSSEQTITSDDVRRFFTDASVQQSAWMQLRSDAGLLACKR